MTRAFYRIIVRMAHIRDMTSVPYINRLLLSQSVLDRGVEILYCCRPIDPLCLFLVVVILFIGSITDLHFFCSVLGRAPFGSVIVRSLGRHNLSAVMPHATAIQDTACARPHVPQHMHQYVTSTDVHSSQPAPFSHPLLWASTPSC